MGGCCTKCFRKESKAKVSSINKPSILKAKSRMSVSFQPEALANQLQPSVSIANSGRDDGKSTREFLFSAHNFSGATIAEGETVKIEESDAGSPINRHRHSFSIGQKFQMVSITDLNKDDKGPTEFNGDSLKYEGSVYSQTIFGGGISVLHRQMAGVTVNGSILNKTHDQNAKDKEEEEDNQSSDSKISNEKEDRVAEFKAKRMQRQSLAVPRNSALAAQMKIDILKQAGKLRHRGSILDFLPPIKPIPEENETQFNRPSILSPPLFPDQSNMARKFSVET